MLRELIVVPCLAALVSSTTAAPPGRELHAPAVGVDPTLAGMRADAVRLRPLVETAAGRSLLDAVGDLPPAAVTTVHYRPGGGYLAEAYTDAQYAVLDEDQRAGLKAVPVDTERFYTTFYGSPLASVRAFDLAARHGLRSFRGTRVLDFGFGSIGQLRLLAGCGADAVGTEVMPLIEAIYADPDVQGDFGDGTVTLAFGRWPAEPTVVERVGTGFDLFISKNTIKRGYVDPPVEVDPRQRMDLGVTHETFLDRLFAALNPRGLAIIYNLGGRPAEGDEPYRPATDIACPWPPATWTDHGFEVLAFDADDATAARAFGAALGWADSMDLERDLFARYTIVRRPRPAHAAAARFTYEPVPGWGRDDGVTPLGNTHGGIVIDHAGRVYVNTDTERSVMVHRPDGTLLRTFADAYPGIHAMTLHREGFRESIYAAHLAGKQVLKMTLDGEVLWTLGVPVESGKYDDAPDAFNPTAVAVGPGGRIFVADGYGRHWIHLYDAERNYVRSFGGPGDGPGQFNTCHGLAIDTRGEAPCLLVCDRENRRLQRFDLDGNFIDVAATGLRRPCAVSFFEDFVAVAELEGRVTILDREFRVVTHVGDNPDRSEWANHGVQPDAWVDGRFTAPHACCFDKEGNLYVMDWNASGRVSKMKRVGR